VAENTVEALVVDPAASRRRRAAARPSASRYAWPITGAGVVAAAILLLLLARTRPGFDPFGWLVWGQQTLHGNLDLGGAPSWKPLPYLFTVPYALTGQFALRLWMVTAAALDLAGGVFAGRIAYRLVGGDLGGSDRTSRYAPIAAAVFAGATVLGLEDYMHYVLSAQSDPMIVTFCLAGIDMYLCGRYRWAFAFGVLGSLGRPEVWPFLGLFTLWAWFKVPSMRVVLCGGIALIAFMWFGIPWITNGRPDIAGQLALRSPRELHQNKVTGTLGRFTELEYLPVWIAAVLTVALGAVRRNRVVLALAAGVVVWVIVEIAFALHGWPALPRYMFEAGGVGGVIAGVGVGWALTEVPKLRQGLPGWIGIPLVAILVATLIPAVVGRVRDERVDLKHERGRTTQIRLLQTTVNTLGGYRFIRSCGEPVTYVEYSSAMAWLMRLNVGKVGYIPSLEKRRRYPIVLFYPVATGGWIVKPWHIRRAERTRCAGLNASYVVTAQHQSGTLIRR
jgi:hypothetical protein